MAEAHPLAIAFFACVACPWTWLPPVPEEEK
jgi:hypothetical protein